jgi:hypothetical protein
MPDQDKKCRIWARKPKLFALSLKRDFLRAEVARL